VPSSPSTAATASPRSEAPQRSALARFLAQESGAAAVEITALAPLAGGAIHQNWRVDARFSGGALAGEQRLVLRTAGPVRFAESLAPLEEFAVLRAVFAAGLAVPEPLFASAEGTVCGRPFFVMRRIAGTAAPARITGAEALPQIAERLGRELARLHRIRPPRRDLPFLEERDLKGRIAALRAALDRRPEPRPVLEWGLRWLETHPPDPIAPVLCHRDFRTGNYLVADGALTAILDWEFAGWGDPHEDIGWFCCKAWRFARLDREAGGIADRRSFYRGYESAAARRIDAGRVYFWEVFASVRWAVIALQQCDRYMLGGERNLDLALTGRRATESELEILMLLDPAFPRMRLAPGKGRLRQAAAELAQMREAPSGPALLALAGDVLQQELVPLLPPERQDEARLVAAAIALGARDAAAADAPFAAILRDLRRFYAAAPFCGGAKGGEDPRNGRAKGGTGGLLRRFADDLRRGAFACQPARERDARALLWRLTLAKLQTGNPQFLAANGFA
jgi:aminoglycoside phosphotransferase (APT) family kinase protein